MEQIVQADVKISVIIPAYNAALYIERTLRSVFEQSLPDFEIVLIDDGSSDDTREIVEELQQEDTRLKYFRKDNGGVSSARNLGIEKAKGEFISFLDSDDTYEPDFLEKMYGQITKVGGDLCYCGYWYETNDKKRYTIPVTFEIGDPLAFMLKGGMMTQTACWCIRRSFSERTGVRFTPGLQFGEDMEFFSKLLCQERSGVLTHIGEYLVNYNLHEDSLSSHQVFWYRLPRMLGDIRSREGIYDYVSKSGITHLGNELASILVKVKERYLYYLWGTLLLGNKEDFNFLYQSYKQDKDKYSLRNILLPGMKNRVWEFCVSTSVGRFAGRYIFRYYKYIQRRYLN